MKQCCLVVQDVLVSTSPMSHDRMRAQCSADLAIESLLRPLGNRTQWPTTNVKHMAKRQHSVPCGIGMSPAMSLAQTVQRSRFQLVSESAIAKKGCSPPSRMNKGASKRQQSVPYKIGTRDMANITPVCSLETINKPKFEVHNSINGGHSSSNMTRINATAKVKRRESVPCGIRTNHTSHNACLESQLSKYDADYTRSNNHNRGRVLLEIDTHRRRLATSSNHSGAKVQAGILPMSPLNGRLSLSTIGSKSVLSTQRPQK